jgi:hypothetical protein
MRLQGETEGVLPAKISGNTKGAASATLAHIFWGQSDFCSYLICKGLLLDLTGIEPVTSSMPWNEPDIKLLTAKDLLVG